MLTALALACVAAAIPGGIQQQDLYPKIHTLLLEADALSVQIRAFDDRSVPSEWGGHLLARAGYLQDAARAASRSAKFPLVLVKAYVLYGQLAVADKMLACVADPADRANAQLESPTKSGGWASSQT
jgi:hypothetical protein